jgi:hypothetical protein
MSGIGSQIYSPTDWGVADFDTSPWGSNYNTGKQPKSGGKKPMAFGWDDAILGVGMLAQGAFGAIGASKQANTQAAIANAQMAAQADAVRNSRDMTKGQIAMSMWSNLFNTTTAADIDFGRQLAAKRKEYSEFIPKGFGLDREGLDREQARWQTDFALSPAARELASRQRLGRVKEAIAPGRAQMTGMFGRIAQAPTESFMV